MQNPNKCSALMCEMPIGPDALTVTHKGEPAGGLCEKCIQGAVKLRVVFELDANGIYEIAESQPAVQPRGS